ncbi:MAG: radical SAM protein [Myxococcales bacterium]|nr:radical SAM protein [Myxococcales bacterium]
MSSVVVSEVFLSLQGESTNQGKLCAFVRLTGCNLRCRWCDTEYAFTGGERMEVGEVVAKVKALGVPMVEVTGGEPLLQPGVYPLMRALLALGLTVLLETSGSIDVREVPAGVRKIVDLKAPSSGECERNDFRVLDSMGAGDELKLVLGSREDYEWCKRTLLERGLLGRPFEVLLSAVHGELPPDQLASWIIEDKLPVRLQLQQHKLLWPERSRGV